ncbi:hypothetical protein RHGRI_020893 [Rhododendron griersonianum]|uniref:Uncharacterized protein n=1 Tax=Rhododendron griersonianum TaxID=479676 RepID=A0AAV6JMJ7_9ERIC|nr:hypothetical protein RHGRI_020893 [Rhododendron griersonianum]
MSKPLYKKRQVSFIFPLFDFYLYCSCTLACFFSYFDTIFLSQITDFCNDLKKLATRAKESENAKWGYGKKSQVVVKKWKEKECDGENIGELDVREKERKPLLEVNKEKCEIVEKSNVKEKLRRKKRAEEAKNIPISLDVKNVNGKEGDVLLPIRTCPPSPQYFSAGHAPSKATPLKASRSRPPVSSE